MAATKAARYSQRLLPLSLAKKSLIRGVDHTVIKYLLKPPKRIRQRSAPERLTHSDRIVALKAFAAVYNRSNQQQRRETFVQGLTGVPCQEKLIAKSGDRLVYDLAWPSYFEPLWQDHHSCSTLRQLGIDRQTSFRAKFFGAKENLVCRARWFRKPQAGSQRSLMICLHGYFGGNLDLEERTWPLALFAEYGFDVVIMVLPFHGPRKERHRRFAAPRFPSADPRFTIEAFRQTVFDYQTLKGAMTRRGYNNICVSGMSLGGFASTLIHSLDPTQALVMPIIPLGNLVDLPLRQGRLAKDPAESAVQEDCLRNLFRLVDPLGYQPPVGSSEQVHVMAGEADGITGLVHAHKLQQHFGCQLHLFQGGHLIRSGMKGLCRQVLEQVVTPPSR